MVKKADDVVIIENSNSDLDEVLAEADIDRLDEASRDALRDALNAMQAHPLNAGRGKPSVLVPGVNVHFRLVPVLVRRLSPRWGLSSRSGLRRSIL